MKVEISDLTFKCIIGILPKERIKKQIVIIDLSFKYKFTKKNFIDYSHVAKDIEQIMKKEKFFLIEDAIKVLKKYLINNYKLIKPIIKISKPTILKNCNVSVANK